MADKTTTWVPQKAEEEGKAARTVLKSNEQQNITTQHVSTGKCERNCVLHIQYKYIYVQ